MRKYNDHILLIVLLALLSSVPPLGTDAYIPAIPSMSKFFGINIEKIEITISIFLLGFSLGQLIGGVLSDNIGRKKSSLLGLFGFGFFSFMIVFSTNIYELWFYRFFEAIFGGLAFINSFAVVRDKFHGNEAAKVLSLIGSIGAIAPLIAPVIGSGLIHFFSWKTIFIFLGSYSFLIFLAILLFLEESYKKDKNSSMLSSIKSVFSKKEALKYMLILGVSFSGMFVFISKSSFIYIEYFKVSKEMFPLYFGINFILIILMVKVNIYLLRNSSIKDIVKSAFMIQIIDGILFILFSGTINIGLTMVFIGIYMICTAFIMGNLMSLALEHFPNNAGVATSIMGVLQFGLASLISSLVLIIPSNSLYPVSIGITLITLVAFLLLQFGFKKG